MYYSVPYLGSLQNNQKLIPVFGKFVGFYLLEETPEPIEYNTISEDNLYSGNEKLQQGNIVTLSANGKQYFIKQRRVQKFPGWIFKPGAFIFFGLQHDHPYVLDYQQAAWYKEHSFVDLEGWFVNQDFTPVFGIFIDEALNDPKEHDIVLFEHKGQIRNPRLNYIAITTANRINDIYHEMTYCVEQVEPSVTQDTDFVKVRFTMNKTYAGQVVNIKPLVNVPVASIIELDARGTGEVVYKTSHLHGANIMFDVYPNNISAGCISVDITNPTTFTIE